MGNALSSDSEFDTRTFILVVAAGKWLIDASDEFHVLHNIVEGDEEGVVYVVALVEHLGEGGEVLLHPRRQLIRFYVCDDVLER